ncbi:IS66 family insertion sequence element accessory protein TnpB [Paraburkholderia strydomiana]|uniref:IS66 family insertion sequence element accessory protein TnpB n=1 Tax=Paraburkholderia strydomiana TaxID=1245417 RepID=UPI0038B70297
MAACQGPGVSVAAIALMHKLNANLLRRWLEKAESGATTTGSDVVAMKPSAAAPISPAFVPLQVSDVNSHQREIRVEVRRSQQSITVSWPTSDAAQCAAWLREWLK